MADLFYIIATLAYTAFSLYLLWWFFSAIRQTRRNTADLIASLGNIGQKLDTLQTDVTSIKGRVERLENAAVAYQAGIAAVSAEAAE
jgi:hypothetical protein